MGSTLFSLPAALRLWPRGRTQDCGAGDPGSTPGVGIYFEVGLVQIVVFIALFDRFLC